MREPDPSASDPATSRKRFLASMADVRPRLHAYCSRMVGSALDGEDVLQDTLVQAYEKLSLLDPSKPVEPWLFRIAHNKCIDFLRRRRDHVSWEDSMDEGTSGPDPAERSEDITRALTTLFVTLPPKERAAVILKDVLDYSLAETADVIGSTVGGVKAALHRARTKLADRAPENLPARPHADARLLERYIESFNARDWDAVQTLIQEDATLEVVGVAELAGRGTIAGTYFVNYGKLPYRWQLTLGSIDGEEVVVVWRSEKGAWVPRTAIRMEVVEGRVTAIRDYVHVDYLLTGALVDAPTPTSP